MFRKELFAKNNYESDGDDKMSLVDDPQEGCHDLHGNVRQDDVGLLGGHVQVGADQEGTQREN